jgi:hypothetical protein
VLPSRQPPIRKKLPKKKARPSSAGSDGGGVAMAADAMGFTSGVLVVLGHGAVNVTQAAMREDEEENCHSPSNKKSMQYHKDAANLPQRLD